MKKYILVLFTFCMSFNCYSQITTNEQPVSLSLYSREDMQHSKGKLLDSQPVSLPIPDMENVYAEDAENDKKIDNVFRVGIRIPVSYNSKENGKWTTLDDGSRLWKFTVTAESAQSLDLAFSKFWLPDNTKFFVYNPHSLETIGAITSEYLQGDKENPAKFSTAIVRGDTLTLEYYQPKDVIDAPIIELSGVYYGYRTLSTIRNSSLFGHSFDCEVNVRCSEGTNWTDEKKAVTCIQLKDTRGSFVGTGSLVMNTSMDFKPYVLTANHILYELQYDAVSNPDMSLSVFYWNYEAQGCSSSQFSYLSTAGATLIANPESLDSINAADFALLQLQQDPRFLNDFTPYYLGWNRSASNPAGGVCIHHPKGDVKKISTYSCTPLITKKGFTYEILTGSYLAVNWIQTENNHGITEPGSSGAPLINSNHKLIGQFCSAPSGFSCDNPNLKNYFGRFYTSWTGNGSSSSYRRLKDWLDPLETNQTTISGCNGNSIYIVGQLIPCGPEVYYVNYLPSSYTVEWQFQNPSSSLSNLIIQNYPLQNQCTINLSSGQEISETLLAKIKYNGQVVKTISKNLYNVHYIGGAYSQEPGSTSPAINVTPFGGAQPILVYPNALVTITSSALQNKNVSYSGSPLSYWNYTSSTGTIKLKFPQSTNSQAITISANSFYNCEKSLIDVVANLSTSLLPSSVFVSVEQNRINFVIEEKKKTQVSSPYLIEVVNSVTGCPAYSGVLYDCMSVSTVGWTPGIYVVICKNDGNRDIQKIIIK
jgi:hypothetical protein